MFKILKSNLSFCIQFIMLVLNWFCFVYYINTDNSIMVFVHFILGFVLSMNCLSFLGGYNEKNKK